MISRGEYVARLGNVFVGNHRFLYVFLLLSIFSFFPFISSSSERTLSYPF